MTCINVTDWVRVSLDKLIATIQSGTRPKGGASTEFGDVPSFGGENLTVDGKVKINDVKLVPIGFYKYMSKGHLAPGDVLINKDGAQTGKVGFFDYNLNPACINEHLFLIRGRNHCVTQKFLYYTLLSETGQRQVRSQISGSAQPGLKAGFIQGITVDLPCSLTEQTKITHILSTVDRAIEQTEALIEKQQRIKTGLMQDLLTRGIDEQGNLRSEETHQFKDSPLGRIPVEWEIKQLGPVLKQAHGFLQTGPFGSQLHAGEYSISGIPVIMPQDISNGEVCNSQIARILESRASSLARHRVQPQDIIFARRGDLSRAATINSQQEGWVCGTGCFLLRVSNDEINTRWLTTVYRHYSIQRQVYTNSVGATMPSLNNSVMSQLLVAFPSRPEQHAIATYSDKIETRYRTSVECLSKLCSLKAALMQDLLTGRKRVTSLLVEKEIVNA